MNTLANASVSSLSSLASVEGNVDGDRNGDRNGGLNATRAYETADLARGHRKMESRPPEDFDAFFDEDVYDPSHRLRAKDFKEVLRRQYSGDAAQGLAPAETYREFVRRLSDVDCVLLESWLTRFVDSAFGTAAYGDFYWIVEAPDVADIRSSPTFKVAIKDQPPGEDDRDASPVPLVGGAWTPQKDFSQLEFYDVPRLMR